MSQLIKSLLRRAGYELSPIAPSKSIREENPDVTDMEWDVYSRVKTLTMLSMERILANIRAIEHIVLAQIPGDIVECGVWRGGSAMSMALALRNAGDISRTIWLYDTYAGMTEATSVDVSHAGVDASALLKAAKELEIAERSLVLAYASLEDVQANMRATGYPTTRIKFVKGPIEETVPSQVPDQIALLRLDTDWYESTRHELIHLYPRLAAGGVLIIDDYGHWQGARRAVDEYFESQWMFLNRIDYTGRLGVKPPSHDARPT
jgi:O-methyltransferase